MLLTRAGRVVATWNDRAGGLLTAAAAYLVAALALTWPVVLSPASRVVGGAESDVWKHLWGHA